MNQGFSEEQNQGSFEEIVKGFFESEFLINALATFKETVKEVESSKSIERIIRQGLSSERNIKVIKEMIKVFKDSTQSN